MKKGHGMQAPLKDKNDIKIFILYLMRNVGYPLDFPSINDIVVQDGFVNYFDFAECFSELIGSNNVCGEKQPDGETLYSVTEQGKNVADSLQSDLMVMIREKSLKNALRLLSFRKRGAKVMTGSEKREDGKYVLNCRIIEKGKETLNISITADSKRQLDMMEMNFLDHPETVFRGMYTLLTGEINYLIN